MTARRNAFAMRKTIVAAVLLLAACVTTNTIPLGTPMKYPAVPWQEVQVFLKETDVPGEFTKIAMISAEGAHGWTSQSGMVDAVRKKAGPLGANGIILEQIEEPSAGAKVAGAVFGVAAKRHGQVVAIRYTPK